MKERGLFAKSAGAIAGILTACLGQPAIASCPESISDCLGEAKNFAFVASDKLMIGTWREVIYNYADR
jgi:hypothetical protein